MSPIPSPTIFTHFHHVAALQNLRPCFVCTLCADGDSLSGCDGLRWSFNYFFVNKTLKRIGYFTCMAKRCVPALAHHFNRKHLTHMDVRT